MNNTLISLLLGAAVGAAITYVLKDPKLRSMLTGRSD